MLERALDSRGPVRAVEALGDPGMGKTRLLAEFAGRAAQKGHVVLAGSASELERELPFCVFVDALDEHLQTLDPRHWLTALDADEHEELAQVLPAVPAAVRSAPGVLRAERYRTHRSVRRLLEVLAAKRSLVLLLDDLHWADSGSLELLGALLRRPPNARVLFVLSLRPRQIPDRLSGAIERAHRARTPARLELNGLTPDQAGELLRGQVSRAVAIALCEESGGNPFYLQQLARSVRRRTASIASGPEAALGSLGFLPSIAASMGLIVWVFQDGDLTSLSGVATAGPVVSFLPVLLIGILFGLAMDYEVFLVSRMRERYAHTGRAREAIVTGYAQSGRVVIAAATIMTGVFGGFVFDADPVLKSIGLSLAFGVIADAFIVRLTLVPAVMALLGRAAWWLPRRVDRVVPNLDIEGEHLLQTLHSAHA